MVTRVLAIILNLSVVLSLRYSQDVASHNHNFLQLNMVLNNLLSCVLVKSFEVVFTGLAAAIHQTRGETRDWVFFNLTFHIYSLSLNFCYFMTVTQRMCMAVSPWTLVLMVWLEWMDRRQVEIFNLFGSFTVFFLT